MHVEKHTRSQAKECVQTKKIYSVVCRWKQVQFKADLRNRRGDVSTAEFAEHVFTLACLPRGLGACLH